MGGGDREVAWMVQKLESQENTSADVGDELANGLKFQDLCDRESNRTMREGVANLAFIFLGTEVLVVMLLMVFQGFGFWGFNLDRWMFGIFANGVLLQSFGIVVIITKNLFKGP